MNLQKASRFFRKRKPKLYNFLFVFAADPPMKPLDANVQPSPDNETHPPIRSFIRRQGRLTHGQIKALENLWPRFGIEPQEPLNAEQRFGGKGPLVLEIGFGNGESLAQMAAQHPETHFVGIDVHLPGVGHLLMRLEEQGLENVRVYETDAVEVLKQGIEDESLDRLQLFFPDPWPKKRHHKRRIVQPEFMDLVIRKLKPQGVFHAATDWEDYAHGMAEVLNSIDTLHSMAEDGGSFSPRPDYRPETKFERRGTRLGHGVFDLLYQKSSTG